MITLSLPTEVTAQLALALSAAGEKECGGVLMAEHVGHNDFVVRQVTVQRAGSFSRFLREIHDALIGLRSFFDRTAHNYKKYNYIGEWHSHPSFPAEPSQKDHVSMREIVQDPDVGATFVVLLVLKLDAKGVLVGSAHTYLKDGVPRRSDLLIERECK